MSISRTELLKLHEEVTAKAREIMTKKNKDYAHEGDVFRNFRYFGAVGILVRLSDKLARLRSFEENNEFAVEDEKLLDTIIDLVNYAVIYLAYKEEQKPEPTPPGYEQEAPGVLLGPSKILNIKPEKPCYYCDAAPDMKSEVTGRTYCRGCFNKYRLTAPFMTLLERA
jgi:hypothetical protein